MADQSVSYFLLTSSQAPVALSVAFLARSSRAALPARPAQVLLIAAFWPPRQEEDFQISGVFPRQCSFGSGGGRQWFQSSISFLPAAERPRATCYLLSYPLG